MHTTAYLLRPHPSICGRQRAADSSHLEPPSPVGGAAPSSPRNGGKNTSRSLPNISGSRGHLFPARNFWASLPQYRNLRGWSLGHGKKPGQCSKVFLRNLSKCCAGGALCGQHVLPTGQGVRTTQIGPNRTESRTYDKKEPSGVLAHSESGIGISVICGP